MATRRQGFWRGFTWKRFIWVSFLFFVISITYVLIENYFDKKQQISEILSLSEIGKTILKSVIIGLILAIWHEPGLDNRKGTQKDGN